MDTSSSTSTYIDTSSTNSTYTDISSTNPTYMDISSTDSTYTKLCMVIKSVLPNKFLNPNTGTHTSKQALSACILKIYGTMAEYMSKMKKLKLM